MDMLISFTLLFTLISLGSTSPVAVKNDYQPEGTVKPPGYVDSDEASSILKLSDEIPLESINLPGSFDVIDSIGLLSAEKVPSAPAVDESKKDAQESVTSQPEVVKSREEADDQSTGVNSAEEKKSEVRTDSVSEIKDKVVSEDEKNNLQPLLYGSQAVNTEVPQKVVPDSKSPEINVVAVKNVVEEKAPVVQASPIVQKVVSSSNSVSSTSVTNGVTVVTSTSVPAKYGNGVKPQEGSELIADSVDQATKLLIDLEEQVKIYLNTEAEASSSTAVPLVYWAGSSVAVPSNPNNKDVSSDLIVEPVIPEEEQNVHKQGATQIQSMIDEVNRVAQNVEGVIHELVQGRRYVTAAVFRSLLNYLRRVRISLERLQNRMQTIGVGQATNLSAETAAVGSALAGSSSVVSSASSSSSSSSSSSGTSVATITNGYLEAIRDRIYRITDEIRQLIVRMRQTFSPTASSSAPQIQ